MAKKSKYPSWWSPYSPPRLYGNKPSKKIQQCTQLHRIPLSDGDVVGGQFQEGLTYRFELEYDYSSCYYESDERTATCCLIGYNEEEIDNPNYKNELAQYNRNKKKHQEALDEWDKWKKIWDEEQEKERILREKAQLKELKKKYENSEL